MTVFWVIAGAAVLGGARYLHVRLFPWKACPSCTKGRVYSGEAHRDCGRCGKTGRVRRWGAPRERQ